MDILQFRISYKNITYAGLSQRNLAFQTQSGSDITVAVVVSRQFLFYLLSFEIPASIQIQWRSMEVCLWSSKHGKKQNAYLIKKELHMQI